MERPHAISDIFCGILASNYQGKITLYTAAALLYPDALATSITLPLEILKAASQMASTRDRGREQVRRLLAGPDRKLIKLASGITLKPDLSPEDEAAAIRDALKQAKGNKSEAARLLGMSRRTIYRKLDKLGITAGE